MKKQTLTQTWILTLRMWRWISKIWSEGDDVEKLKIRWLNENGFVGNALSSNCFFCKYTEDEFSCVGCPGRLVDCSFSCFRDTYSYETKPPAFYQELLRLNRIRKGKK